MLLFALSCILRKLAYRTIHFNQVQQAATADCIYSSRLRRYEYMSIKSVSDYSADYVWLFFTSILLRTATSPGKGTQV